LGTAAYMAPEQARGRVVDKRADIWAFGVVLHEMLTGKKLFQGEDVTETLAKVIQSDARMDGIPSNVQRLLKKCLEKDPKKRLRDIGDAWELLEEPPPSQAGLKETRGRGAMWAAIGVLTISAAGAGYGWWRASQPVDKPL